MLANHPLRASWREHMTDHENEHCSPVLEPRSLLGFFGESAPAMALPHMDANALADFMEDLTGESVSIPQALRYYIDWKAMARDAEMNGEFFTVEIAHEEVHVFSNR